MEAKGYITYAGSKSFGKKTLYSFRISTEEKFFGTGEIDPKVKKNDFVKFTYTERNGYFNVDPNSIEHIGATTGGVGAPAQGNSNGVRQGSTRDAYFADKFAFDKENDKYRKANDLRIQYQSARNAAISVVDVLLRERALKLADGPKADNVAVVMGKITDLTNQFFSDCSAVGGDSAASSGSSVAFDTDADIPFDVPNGKGASDNWS